MYIWHVNLSLPRLRLYYYTAHVRFRSLHCPCGEDLSTHVRDRKRVTAYTAYVAPYFTQFTGHEL